MIRDYLPPILYEFGRKIHRLKYGFHGDFATWQEATSACEGYESDSILSTTEQWTRQVANEKSLNISQRSIRLLAAINRCLLHLNAKNIQILDFGGAMGVHYYSLRPFLDPNIDVKWAVADLPKTVEAASPLFANHELNFIKSIADFQINSSTIILSSCALQYCPEPYKVLQELSLSRYLILDRLPLAPISKDRITVQRVNPSLYRGSYPAWFFSKDSFEASWREMGYELLMSWDVPEDTVRLADTQSFSYKGVLLYKRDY